MSPLTRCAVVLGSKEKTKITITQHLGLDFLERERHVMALRVLLPSGRKGISYLKGGRILRQTASMRGPLCGVAIE